MNEHLNDSLIKDAKKICFVGIGGSSMNGLARYMLKLNKKVYGTDCCESDTISELRNLGCEIITPHSDLLIEKYKPDLVVYTIAVPENCPELQAAKKLQIKILERAVFLGALADTASVRITVSGTHGKTTTTSMVASIFYENGTDPSINIGGELPLIRSNTHVGNGKYFILEACEYQRSFLNFRADIALIINVELDHVDYFKDLDDFISAFKEFCAQIPADGTIIVNGDDSNALLAAEDSPAKKITFGFGKSNDLTAENIVFDSAGKASYDLVENGVISHRIELGTVGAHNILNSLGAIGCAKAAGIGSESCILPLKNFTGAGRRFELKGVVNGITIIDDYAHHPTEIKATLEVAGNVVGDGRLWCIFQPHTYTRTRELLDLLAESFKNAHKVLVTDIYAAREKDPGDIHSKFLVEKIQSISYNACYCDNFQKTVDIICTQAQPGDTVITMGAGTVTDIGPMIINSLK